MPGVVNGIGTWHYGKRNAFLRAGICESCQRHGTLQSYDTTRYFVFLFIPLFGLGRKRVLDHCPHCQRFREIRLREWERLKREGMGGALRAFRDERQNRQKAMAALGKTLAFHDRDAFEKVLPYVRQAFPQDVEILRLLADGYNYFGMSERAVACYRDALTIAPEDTENREAYAVHLLRDLEPKEAATHLVHLLASPPSDEKLGLLALLVEGYQAVGAHKDALEVLARITELRPDVAEDGEFTKARVQSETNLASGAPVTSAVLGRESHTVLDAKNTMWIPRLVASCIVLLILIVYLILAHVAGKGRKIFLVNGLNRAYTVVVGDRQLTLAPHARKVIELDEGEVTVSVHAEGLILEPQSCRIETPLWRRPFLKWTFVLNPDRTAVLLWEELVYRDNSSRTTAPEYTVELHTGRLLHTFRGIDYPFQDFPENIDTSSSRSVRTRLALVSDWPAMTVVELLARQAGRAACIALLQRRLRLEPEAEDYLYTLARLESPQDLVEFLEKALPRRPVVVEWHRLYQDARLSYEDGEALLAQYRRWVAEEPEDPSLQYLAGRMLTNPQESWECFERAVAGDSPCAYGYNAMAFAKLANAQFAEALELAEKAIEHLPRAAFRVVVSSALAALGRYDELLQHTAHITPDGRRLPTYETAVMLLAKGDVEAADEEFGYFLEMLREQHEPAAMRHWETLYEARKAFVQGDLATFSEILSRLPDPESDYHIAVYEGRLSQAAELLSEWPGDHPYEHLVLYIAATNAGDFELAARQLEQAAGKLQKMPTVQEKFFGVSLTVGKPAADCRRLAGLAIPPDRKRILLTAAGLHFDACREQLFDLARKLNFDRNIPYWILAQTLERKSGD